MSGSCLCGAIRYAVDGPLRPVIACHCTQCRKASGHYIAATAADRADLKIEGGDALTWFASSPGVRRGFCRNCGSHLFWDVEGEETLSIFAGSLDGATGLTLADHIFCADKGDYYEIADPLPLHPGYPEGSGR